MSTAVQSILSVAHELTPQQRRELAVALALIDAEPSANRQEFVQSIRGKYRHLASSSEAFLLRKAEETALESCH